MQGKVVVERDEEDGGYLVMFPNGEVERYSSRKRVIEAAKRYFKRHLRDKANGIGIGEIEWR